MRFPNANDIASINVVSIDINQTISEAIGKKKLRSILTLL